MADTVYARASAFSLVYGGPLFRLMLRAGLAGPDGSRIVQRTVLFAATAWLPLLALSALQGTAAGHGVTVPFLSDIVAHTRFLVAVPLLLAAEYVLSPRNRAVVLQFVTSGLVREEDLPRFDEAVAKAARLRDKALPEVLILACVYAMAYFGVRSELSGDVTTWQRIYTDTGSAVSLAGIWNEAVSMPIFQFLSLRWLWRLVIWSIFLWRISRLGLVLMPPHPDRVGGLGFLSIEQAKFGVISFAGSAVASSAIAQRIALEGGALDDYVMQIGGLIILLTAFVALPLFFFSSMLWETRRKGILEYGALANEYTQTFHRKWIKKQAPMGEELVGSSDIQSLADIANGYMIVEKMGLSPVKMMAAMALAAFAAAPMLPLLLTVFSAEEVVSRILQLLL